MPKFACYKKFKPEIITMISTMCILYVAYYLLLNKNFLHSSIGSILRAAKHFNHENHALILGLIPVYISLMIFGASILGIYIGGKIKETFLSKSKQ